MSTMSMIRKYFEHFKILLNTEALNGVHGFKTHKLASRISDLKKYGYVFRGWMAKDSSGNYVDYFYECVKKPPKAKAKKTK